MSSALPLDDVAGPATDDGRDQIHVGHCLDVLRALPSGLADCCVTSVPYYGLRDYDTEPQVWGGNPKCDHEWGTELRGPWADAMPGPGSHGLQGRGSKQRSKQAGAFCRHCGAWRGELGREPALSLYVEHLCLIFDEVRRVLRRDGTLWLNIGDGYSGTHQTRKRTPRGGGYRHADNRPPTRVDGLQEKQLLGVPWRVAFALQDRGWYLRAALIWEKPNGLPESVTDRPARCHEDVFMLSPGPNPFYNYPAMREPAVRKTSGNKARLTNDGKRTRTNDHRGTSFPWESDGYRNTRSVWTIPSEPCPVPGAHYAVMPRELARRCILAGSRPGGVVLDPCGGSGTTGEVARTLGRRFVLAELSEEYAGVARRRVASVAFPAVAPDAAMAAAAVPRGAAVQYALFAEGVV